MNKDMKAADSTQQMSANCKYLNPFYLFLNVFYDL